MDDIPDKKTTYSPSRRFRLLTYTVDRQPRFEIEAHDAEADAWNNVSGAWLGVEDVGLEMLMRYERQSADEVDEEGT